MNEDHEPLEPSVGALVLRGVGLIIGAFLSAFYILMIHTPSGH